MGGDFEILDWYLTSIGSNVSLECNIMSTSPFSLKYDVFIPFDSANT
jgi:hypothetical protein